VSDLTVTVVPLVAAALIWLLHHTVRVRHVHLERIEKLNGDPKGYVMAFWHNHLLLMVHARFRRPITALISQHRDGELISRTVGLLGARSARGSTTRGGSAALRESMRIANAGGPIAITPDGPKGPRHVAQPGAIALAQAARIPIIPVAFVAKKKRL
jgi:lysophospholipid acyltransferase (LPLAT)-like uncharacterized protein